MDYIVVPDGLDKDEFGYGKNFPSNVFEIVLDFVCKIVHTEDRIFIAPANSFKNSLKEQNVAKEYLKRRGILSPIITTTPDCHKYIDTRGNAIFLKNFLIDNKLWPLTSAVLIAYHIHFPRAEIVFGQEGYQFIESVPVKSKNFKRRPIVNRLWYYNYPRIHVIYEKIATLLFKNKFK